MFSYATLYIEHPQVVLNMSSYYFRLSTVSLTVVEAGDFFAFPQPNTHKSKSRLPNPCLYHYRSIVHSSSDTKTRPCGTF